jgi:RNA polymerase sigma factor (TIGR02999 family)
MQPSSVEVRHLLGRWNAGDRAALDDLVPFVYERLHRIAHDRRRNERADLSLNTTAIVHEAYLRLASMEQPRFDDESHFLAVASRVMRRLLVDHARARDAMRRGGDATHCEFTEALCISDERAAELVELDDALTRLHSIDPGLSRMLEQRYFSGLSLEETAEASQVSLATVKRNLRFARAWLVAELGGTVRL